METFGSTEIYGLRHSFVLVGTDIKQDLPLPDNVKRYYMASSNHGGGGGGFASVTPPVSGCFLPSNPTPTNPMRNALTIALVDWVTKGTPMPPSVYPRLADQTLVANTSAAMGYPVIPGSPAPDGLQYPLLDYDLGNGFNYLDESGIPTKVASVLQVLPQVVPSTDRDGNEIAGIKPLMGELPLGTYTGWNVTTNGFYKGQACAFSGGFIPFAKSKAERVAKGDPRLSLEERYPSFTAFYYRAVDVLNRLVAQRYLLPADAQAELNAALTAVLQNNLLPKDAFARSFLVRSGREPASDAAPAARHEEQ